MISTNDKFRPWHWMPYSEFRLLVHHECNSAVARYIITPHLAGLADIRSILYGCLRWFYAEGTT